MISTGMAVAAGDVRLAALREHVGAAAAAEVVLGHARPHLLAGAEPVDRDLALVVAAVRDQDAVLQVLQRVLRDAVDRARRGDEDVRVGQRLLERARRGFRPCAPRARRPDRSRRR